MVYELSSRHQMRRVVALTTGQHKDFLSLIKDPQSLPLDIPLQPENYTKREIKRGLMDLIINKDVKQLFILETNREQDSLVKDLASIKSFVIPGRKCYIEYQTIDGTSRMGKG